jgi:hypothetical protein
MGKAVVQVGICEEKKNSIENENEKPLGRRLRRPRRG